MEDYQNTVIVQENEINIRESLKKFFGFSSFKGKQEAVIKSVLEGSDTFVIMPTGGGKSLCYQLPALMQEGTAIIISPLIALMKNQVDHLRTFGESDGIAHFYNSSLTKKQKDNVKADVLAGNTKLLYVAPESLTKDSTVELLKKVTVSFVAVDEAHCISEWGHDFRPEYRRIKSIVENIGNVPIIALTASATPKVQDDILKNLELKNVNVFKSSFNRDNLYYEVRPKINKQQTLKEIIAYIKGQPGKSGIIYCLSRKTVEEVAQTLNVNGISALAYHAGMDSSTRSSYQDQFLMEDVDVIVATIAFGMGIDKPDVRFVIHYDVPKSIESYYQETGRAGRDGLSSDCIMFYNYADLLKLEKFLKDKPVSEREIGTQLLEEMAAFSENSNCRRKALLHYFGEAFDEEQCNKMCDNCRHPKEKFDAKDSIVKSLKTVLELEDKFSLDHIVKVLIGKNSQEISSYDHDKLSSFGIGKEQNYNHWKSVIRHAMKNGYLEKDIETYGTLRITQKGKKYINKPVEEFIALDRDYDKLMESQENAPVGGAGYDKTLYSMLKDLRKKVAKEKKVPPYIVFQDPSLEEMAIKYPIDIEELSKITGVSESKARRYGKPFTDLIEKYVEENEIERPDDFVVKSVPNKSTMKIYIIQSIDRKANLEDIARAKGITQDELIKEIENIVYSGTKLNLDYQINEMLDPEYQEEIFDYFRTADSDSIDTAIEEFGPEIYTKEELQLMRIKFISEMAN